MSRDQSGYIEGRYIGENIRNIYDIINFTSVYRINGIVSTIDFEKAFDSISWEFLFKTMEKFNFGANFLHWIKVIYSSTQCCVTNNGFNSKFFNLTRGIRQGCPISALLFILVVEIMAINIRQNRDIHGISYNNTEELKISQLADDTTLFLSDIKSLETALNFLKTFEKSSGLSLNKDKTEAFWIGAAVNCNSKPLGLKWTSSEIKCLGVWCGPDVESAILCNYKEKIKKIKTALNIWSQRQLSLKGKVAVLRTQIMPQILYTVSNIYTPEWVITEIDDLFYNYLWSGRKHHVRREVVINNIDQGGLKMPLFSGMIQSIKCAWIKRILSNDFTRRGLLNRLFEYKDLNIDDLIKSKLDIKYVKFHSKFLKQVMECWYNFYSKEPLSSHETANMSLWNNKYILVDEKPIQYNSWKSAGILSINDILKINGNIMSKIELEQKYNIAIKQMDYNSLVHSLPKHWFNMFELHGNENDDTVVVRLNDKLKDIQKTKCRDFYWQYVSTISKNPTAEKKMGKISLRRNRLGELLRNSL